jgi:HAD superfamily hydrolase (TIGR01662 family)
MSDYSIVVPTLGRPCLAAMLESLAAARGPAPRRILLVDDRPRDGWPLTVPDVLAPCTDVLTSGGRGPAAARNLGWRAADTPWIVFLDDDVRVAPDWREALAEDLDGLAERIAGVQGLVSVPLPGHRRPTDWERGTAGLARARWITADMAYRRDALVECRGFDERFPRAFREDADLALRMLADGWRLETGWRRTEHPVRPASAWISVRAQRGNADDALMRAVHGPDWPERAGETRGRRVRHLAIVGSAASAAGLAAAGLRRTAGAAAAAALGGIAEFAAARIVPGPRTLKEVATMTATSVLIPPAAVWHWARGTWLARGARPWPPPPKAILFDRDGTLIHDVPYNGDPAQVVPVRGARDALELARSRGLRIGVVTNQSGIARGRLTPAQVAAVNDRVDELLGPFDTWQVCPHGPGERCLCRKPAPGMIRRAADELGVDPAECLVVGDIGGDIAAAHAAGARAILVPNAQTRPEELIGVRTAANLAEAVDIALGETPAPPLWTTETPAPASARAAR